jgi:hypothetical protein
MSPKSVNLLQSEAFQQSVMVGMDERQRTAIRMIIDNILDSRQNEWGVPVLSGTVASHLGLTLLFVMSLDSVSKSEVLADVLGIKKLSVKNWIDRLRNECGCSISWEKPLENNNWSNRGQYVVHHWGIFDQKVFEAFEPYAKLCFEEWVENSDMALELKYR